MTAKTSTGDGRAFAIGGRMVGPGHPAYIVAELSANHAGDLDRALEIVRLAAMGSPAPLNLAAELNKPSDPNPPANFSPSREGAGRLPVAPELRFQVERDHL